MLLCYGEEAGEIEFEVLDSFLKDLEAVELSAVFRGEDGGIWREHTFREVAGGFGRIVALDDFRIGEAAAKEHLTLLERLVMGGDCLDVFDLSPAYRKQTVNDGDFK